MYIYMYYIYMYIYINDFNKNAKFTLIESLTNTNKVATETLKERLKNRESFWIIKLRTLTPNGLNQELN